MDDPKTAIKLLKLIESSKGAELTIHGEEEPFLVSLETVHRRRLVEGVVLTEAQLAALKEESALYQCDRLAARLLAMRDHSVGELRLKLRRRGMPASAVQSVLKKYRDNGALDDARYALAVGRSLLSRRPCAQNYLTAYLQRKRIDRELATQTAETLLDREDDDKLALAALEQRWSRFGQFELETARTKAYNYLARRGFGYRSAKAAFEQLWRQTQKESEDQDR
jgi:SOS response regulatory protein OraA/RecX